MSRFLSVVWRLVKALRTGLMGLLVFLLLFLLLLAALLFYLSTTESGTSTVLNWVSSSVPELEITQTQGALLDTLTAQTITWQKDGVDVTVNEATLEVALPTPDVRVKKLIAKKITVQLPKTEEEPNTAPFALVIPDIKLPINVDLQQVEVDELFIQQGEALIKLRDVALRAEVKDDTLFLHQLAGDFYDDEGNVTIAAEGNMGLSTPHPINLTVKATANSQLIGVGDVKLAAHGEVTNYDVTLTGDWKYATYPKYAVDFKAKGNLEQLDVQQLDLDGDAGKASLQGKMTWTPELRWDLDLQGKQLNAGIFAADYPSKLNMVWASTGSLKDKKVRMQLVLKQLTGRLQKYPVDASMQLFIEDNVVTLNALKAQVSNNQLTATGTAGEELDIDWQLDAPQLAELHPAVKGRLIGKGRLVGKPSATQFALSIAELQGKLFDYPVQAKGGARIDDQLISVQDLVLNVGDNRLNINGSADESQGIDWQLQAKNLTQLSPALKGKLQGKGNVKGLLDGSRAALRINTLRGKVQDFPIQAEGELKWQDKLISARDLSVQVGNNRIQLNGSADESQGIDWQLQAKNLAQLSPAVKGKLQGKGNIKGMWDGSLDKSRATLRIDRLQGKIQDYPVQATGLMKVRDKIVQAQDVQLSVGKNQLKLNGNTADDLGLAWQLNAPKLSQLYKDLKGNVKGSGKASGELDGSAFKVQITRLKGTLQGRPLNVKGKVSSTKGKITLDDIVVLAGKNRLQANGKASEPFDLKWEVDAPALKQVWPDLAGSLRGKGRLSGKLEQLQINADLKGKRLRYQDMRIAALALTAKQKGEVYTIKASVDELQQANNHIQQLTLDGQGKITAHTLKLFVHHKEGKLDLQAAGGWKKEQWQGSIEQLNVRDTVAGNWRLNKAVQLKASAKAVSSSDFCLANQAKARACVQGQWSKADGAQGKGRLQQVPLAMARPWLPETVSLAGVLNADFAGSRSKQGKIKGQLDVRLPDSSVTLRLGKGKGKQEILYYRNAAVNVVLNDKNTRFKAGITLKDRGQLQAEGQFDLADNMQQSRLNAQAKVNVPDIAWVQQFSNDIDQLKGQLIGNVDVAGTLGKPRVTGQLQLQNTSLVLPEAGVRLQEINVTARANRADQMLITGRLKAGDGVLNAKGKLILAELPKWRADVALTGERLLLMNTHEVQAYVSPQLSIKASPQQVTIDGMVTIPETTIMLRELPVSAKKRSDDIVIVGRDQSLATNKRRLLQSNKRNSRGQSKKDIPSTLLITPNVTVVLGDKIRFSGLGFDARLTGKLKVLNVKQKTVAQGVLNIIDGVYKKYGQDLEITTGRLLFDGPLDNPELDIRAVRNVTDDLQVGIALRGTVPRIESSLFSTPQQTQTDTLSYLLTGRAFSNTSSGDSAMLSSAIAGLGINGGESLAQTIGGKLGFDDVGISSDSGNYEESELSLGKKIGSRLYVRYIVGLFDALQKVAVTYQINKRLEAEVRSGEQQEIDLNYKFDTNRGLFGR